MKKNGIYIWILIVILGLSLGFTGWPATSAWAEEALRITKEELKNELGSPDLMIIDVRSGRDWKSSEFKIKGAVRENPYKYDIWAQKYPKDKKIVLYCA
jgi:hypothetical protein